MREVHSCNVHPSLDHFLAHLHGSRGRAWTEDRQVNEIRATDLLRHPQLQADIEAFKTHYSKSAVSVRCEYMTIDEVDIDLIIKSDFLNALVTKAWKINSSEPIIIRLHFSLSQYLDGPAPTVEVLQSSNRHTFCIGKQLQNILTAFINNEWRNLTNEKVICHQKRRNSWFRPAGTIKKFRARFNIWLPSSKYIIIYFVHCKLISFGKIRFMISF
uniref:Uncharacterized protein n=1 Tax=Periophthalmus magnuspinnatus TaxID=409849 RepID=A0A3B3ZUE4_9GOBI